MPTAQDLASAFEEADYWYEELPEEWVLVEECGWDQDGKYQSQSMVFQNGEQFFQINRSRSGSYHSDWYYNSDDVFEVERKVVTKEVVSWKITGPVASTKGRD